MEYSLESNERTLVMFDAICNGLSNCLSLVHADIRQMTEHRNRLAQIEQEQIRAKCRSAQELFVMSKDKGHKNKSGRHSKINQRTNANETSQQLLQNNNNSVDSLQLASLKLLDKRLVESFSQALNLNDPQKQQVNQSKPSIFQVLLGKTLSKKSKNIDKLNGTKQPVENKLIIDDINRQIRLAMQYIKQLEAHLYKIEDLRPKYEMHLKMGLVHHHYSSSSSLKSTTNTTSSTNINNKTTIREFIDNINKIEQEFESFMGSFLLAIEDIQGFARVCQGDVFEIIIKYGESQKFKTRISVLKDNKQKCDNRQTVFKAKIADILAIKAYECKGLGKKVLLGHKLCETRDLFTAQSQLMTISLNQTGSIKLNLIVTWNPLHMTPNSTSTTPGSDISHISLPPTPISSSTLSSLSSVPSMNGTTTTINIRSPNRAKNNHQGPLYQTIDPNYGYYIPEPDYLTNEV